MRTLLCLAATVGLSTSALAYDNGYGHDRGYAAQDRYGSYGQGYEGNVHYAHGEVLDVQPIYQTSQYPSSHQVCYEQPVERYHRERPRSAAGTVLGAIIGGAIGHRIGHHGHGYYGHRHSHGATAAGAAIGAAIGYNSSRGPGYVSRGYEQRCQVQQGYESSQDVVGYDVTYRYRGEIYQTRTNYHPGDSIRVRVAVDAVN